MPQAIPIILAVVGTGMSIYSSQQAQAAQDDYNNKQEALQNQQKQLALQQQDREAEGWKAKSENIVDEAGKLSTGDVRNQAMQAAEDTATASNVSALEQANALGDTSVGQSAAGDHSDAYLQARAKAASEQTDKAIGMARLFGKQGAIGDALQNQGLSAIDNTLKGQAIDFKVRQGNRGFTNTFDLLNKQSAATKFDSSAGQTAGALGGMFMSAGAKGIGSTAGSGGYSGGFTGV